MVIFLFCFVLFWRRGVFLQCFECDLPAFAYAKGCSQLAIHLFLKILNAKTDGRNTMSC